MAMMNFCQRKNDVIVPTWLSYINPFLMIIICLIGLIYKTVQALCNLISTMSVGIPCRYKHLLRDAQHSISYVPQNGNNTVDGYKYNFKYTMVWCPKY
jgi:hypothetical protein